MNVITYLEKIATSIKITNPTLHNTLIGRDLGGRMVTNPKRDIENYIKNLNKGVGRQMYAVEPTLKQYEKIQPGLGKAYSKSDPLVLYAGEDFFRKKSKAKLDRMYAPYEMAGVPDKSIKAMKKFQQKTDYMMGLPTPKESSKMYKTHEESHLSRFGENPKNPRSPFLPISKRKGGVRTLKNIAKEEFKAYKDQALKTPNLRKRTRALELMTIPVSVLKSTRVNTGGIRKEISRGTLGRLAKKILRKR